MGDWLERYSDWVVRWHKWVVIGCLLAVIVVAAGTTRLGLTGDIRVFFSDENPQLKAYNALEQAYNKQDILQFLVVPDDGVVFKEDTLRLLQSLTDETWRLPYSLRIDSLANYNYTTADEDLIESRPLIDRDFDFSDASIAALNEIVEIEPEVRNTFLSKAFDMSLIQVRVNMPVDNILAPSEVVAAARVMVAETKQRFPAHRIYLSGTVAVNDAFGLATQQDMKTFIGLSYLIIIAVLYFMLRNLSGTVLTLVIVFFSLLTAFGMMGWAGKVLTPSAGFVPTIIMTIAVADAIHLLIWYYHQLHKGDEKERAVKEAIKLNFLPITLTSLTTAIGFLTLNFNESPPFRDLGNIVVLGVSAALIFSLLFLPAFLAWIKPVKTDMTARVTSVMTRLAQFVIVHRYQCLVITLSLVLLLGSFAPQNTMREDWNNQFDETFEIRQAIDLMHEKIGGVHYIHYSLDSGQPEGVNDPEFLSQVRAFREWYVAQPEVAFASDLTQIIERINMNMHGDDVTQRVLPTERTLISQYLFLYEMTLPMGMELNSILNGDRSATRFVGATTKLDSTQLIDLDDRAQAWLAQNAPLIKPTEGTGLDMIIARVQQRNIASAISTAIFALALISLIMIVTLRSVKLGLISLIPNLAPAALTYGIWALFVGEVNMAAALVMTMALGIVVDDTVHFMTKYSAAKRAGKSNQEAVREAFTTVGVAMVMTSAILVFGFAVTAGSHFQPTVYAGALMAMTLSFALVIDFLLLPPLLMLFDKDQNKAIETRQQGDPDEKGELV